MNGPINSILFDFGGTLRRTIKRDEHERRERVQQILQIIGSEASPVEFSRQLSDRYRAYRRWAEQTMIGLDEAQLWTQWMLPDWPADQIHALAYQLHQTWREATKIRVILPETKGVIRELSRRGYQLGIASNTISRTELLQTIREIGISEDIKTVVLSSVLGKRKPDPSMLLAAAAELGNSPDRCAYVGNHLDRDVAAARRAGFGKAIIICNLRVPWVQIENASLIPDYIISNLTELLDIFPPDC